MTVDFTQHITTNLCWGYDMHDTELCNIHLNFNKWNDENIIETVAILTTGMHNEETYLRRIEHVSLRKD